MRSVSVAWRVAAALAFGLVAGCLPLGNPPGGQRLLAGRDRDRVSFLDGPDGGAPRLMALQLRQDETDAYSTWWSAYAVGDPDPTTGLAAETLLLDHLPDAAGPCDEQACGFLTDSRGRALFTQFFTSESPDHPGAIGVVQRLVRVDPVTGDRTDFGETGSLAVSADRARFAYTVNQPLTVVVRDVDDREVRIPDAAAPAFIGDDLFFVTGLASRTTSPTVYRLRPTGAPEVVATDAVSVTPLESARGRVLTLCRVPPAPDPAAPPGGCTASLLDPGTLTETALPADIAAAQSLSVSPSGRFILGTTNEVTREGGATTLTAFDRDTGVVSSWAPHALSYGLWWRPQHDQLWFQDADGLWAWRPGQDAVLYAAAGVWFPGSLIGLFSQLFTPDGRFFVAIVPGTGEKAGVYLRSADDPAAEPLLLNPDGTGTDGPRVLPDGRLLVEAWIKDRKRNDIYLVDPVARTARPLASGGNVVAVGATRALMLLRWTAAGGSGDLTLVDLESGAISTLAENVFAVAVEQRAPGADALAAGTRVAYLVRNRIASPYDGLWVNTLP